MKWQTLCSPFLFPLQVGGTDCPTHISLKALAREQVRVLNLMLVYLLNNNPVDFPGK